MSYDDDRDYPLSDRIRLSDLLPFRRRRAAEESRPAPEPDNQEYRCPGRTNEGKRCRRTKLGDPDFVCHDHAYRRWP
jgi:hypothetical protein